MMVLDIRIMSLNVAGLVNLIKCKQIAKYLKEQKADIICLQETHLKPLEAKLLYGLFQGDIYQSFSGHRSAGVLIGIKFGIPWTLKQHIPDPSGRYVILQELLFGQEITVIGIYASNQNQTTFQDNLKQCIPASNTEEVLMLGNFKWNYQ